MFVCFRLEWTTVHIMSRCCTNRIHRTRRCSPMVFKIKSCIKIINNHQTWLQDHLGSFSKGVFRKFTSKHTLCSLLEGLRSTLAFPGVAPVPTVIGAQQSLLQQPRLDGGVVRKCLCAVQCQCALKKSGWPKLNNSPPL